MANSEFTDALDLFQKPKRPSLKTASLSSTRQVLNFLGSPLLALVVAVLAWLVPSVPIRTLLRLILAIVVASVIILFTDFFRRWLQYIGYLERRSLRLRSVLLEKAGLDERVSGNGLRFSIVGIMNRSGTVNLVLENAGGLRAGALLHVIATPTGEIWGTVQIGDISEGRSLAGPYDRTNPEFWEHLEDRMRRDPSPPPGVHLEPYMDPMLRDWFQSATDERE